MWLQNYISVATKKSFVPLAHKPVVGDEYSIKSRALQSKSSNLFRENCFERRWIEQSSGVHCVHFVQAASKGASCFCQFAEIIRAIKLISDGYK